MIIGALVRWQQGILVYQGAIEKVMSAKTAPVDKDKVLNAVFFVACIIKRAISEIEQIDNEPEKKSLPARIKAFPTQVVTCQNMVGNRPSDTKDIPLTIASQLLTEFRSADLYQTDEEGCTGILITSAIFPHPILLIRWSEILRICQTFIDLRNDGTSKTKEPLARVKPDGETATKSAGTEKLSISSEFHGRMKAEDKDEDEDEEIVHRRRYIPNWIGPRFINYLAGRMHGSTEPPIELRHILDNLSLSSMERLADATLDDLDPA